MGEEPPHQPTLPRAKPGHGRRSGSGERTGRDGRQVRKRPVVPDDSAAPGADPDQQGDRRDQGVVDCRVEHPGEHGTAIRRCWRPRR